MAHLSGFFNVTKSQTSPAPSAASAGRSPRLRPRLRLRGAAGHRRRRTGWRRPGDGFQQIFGDFTGFHPQKFGDF